MSLIPSLILYILLSLRLRKLESLRVTIPSIYNPSEGIKDRKCYKKKTDNTDRQNSFCILHQHWRNLTSQLKLVQKFLQTTKIHSWKRSIREVNISIGDDTPQWRKNWRPKKLYRRTKTITIEYLYLQKKFGT